jgi:hypothetical protein
VKDPVKIIQEMLRVSKRWVVCLAESDASARIVHPAELEVVKDCVLESVVAVGGNIKMGRQLQSTIRGLGYEPRIGVSTGVYGREVAEMLSDEWSWVEETLSSGPRDPPISEVRSVLYKCIEDGTAFSFAPIFHAVVDKCNDGIHG